MVLLKNSGLWLLHTYVSITLLCLQYIIGIKMRIINLKSFLFQKSPHWLLFIHSLSPSISICHKRIYADNSWIFPLNFIHVYKNQRQKHNGYVCYKNVYKNSSSICMCVLKTKKRVGGTIAEESSPQQSPQRYKLHLSTIRVHIHQISNAWNPSDGT